jgi:pilus assembly protein Flp/PilA
LIRFLISEEMMMLRRLIRNEDGPTAVEYAIMLALVAMVCIVGVKRMGKSTNTSFKSVSKAVKVKGS